MSKGKGRQSELSADQARAVQDISKRLRDGCAEIRLGGLAGTGKTYLAARMPKLLGLNGSDVMYLTPTHSAARVLRGKLAEAGTRSSVSTVHRFLYHPPQPDHCATCRAEAPRLGRCHVAADIRERKPCGCGRPLFYVKDTSEYRLIVVDECSMLRREEYTNLTTKDGYQFLFCGDFGQLPPVNDKGPNGRGFNVMAEDRLDVALSTPHRQAADSPVISMAYQARNGLPLPIGRYDAKGWVNVVGVCPPISRKWYRSRKTIMLAWKNVDVQRLNERARTRLGFTAPLEVGDRIVCRDNRDNRRLGVHNGMLGTVEKVTPFGADYRTRVRLDGLDRSVDVTIHGPQLASPEMLAADPNRRAARWKYGYCITVHCAQGSEWRDVVVFDDPDLGRTPSMYRRWLYTALTRSAGRLTLVRS